MAESNIGRWSHISTAEEEFDPGSSRSKGFCHSCEAVVDAMLPDMICTRCNGGFVEEINEQDQPRPADHHASSASTQQPPSQRGHTVVFRMGGGSSGRRPFQMLMADVGLPQSSSGASNQRLRHPFEALLSQVLGGFGNMVAPVHGNPGDYVWGPGGLDAIITQLLNNVEGSGPPPADQAKIDGLLTVKISSNQVANSLQCSVCFDDFKEDEEVKVLPCRHHYHQSCIIPWLEMHGTCPVCRKDLNGDDTTTQEFDGGLGETLNNLNVSEGGDNFLTPTSQTDSDISDVSEHDVSSSSRRHAQNRSPSGHDDDVD